jgi:hypothetical protein
MAKIDLVESSGMLCVNVDPRCHWLAGLVVFGGGVFFGGVLYRFWPGLPVAIRVVWIGVLISALLSLVYETFGNEVIKVDAKNLMIRKGIRGCERRRKYQINECRDLEWNAGRGHSHLACRVGRREIKFGSRLTEDDGNEIMSALQRTLPDVAQKICAPPMASNAC